MKHETSNKPTDQLSHYSVLLNRPTFRELVQIGFVPKNKLLGLVDTRYLGLQVGSPNGHPQNSVKSLSAQTLRKAFCITTNDGVFTHNTSILCEP